MAQNVTIAGASYSNVPSVEIPKTGGGTAVFVETSDATATASDILSSKTAYVNGEKITGTGSGGGGNSATVTFTASTSSTSTVILATDSNFAAHRSDETAVLTVTMTANQAQKSICHYMATNVDIGATSTGNYGIKQVCTTTAYTRTLVASGISQNAAQQGTIYIDSNGNLKFVGNTSYPLYGTFRATLTW